MDLQGPHFSDSRNPMMIFADSRDPVFNSRDPNRVPKKTLKKLHIYIIGYVSMFIQPECDLFCKLASCGNGIFWGA